MEHGMLIEELHRCAAQCLYCFEGSDKEENKEALQKCMVLNMKCAETCKLVVQMLDKNTNDFEMYLKRCSIICLKCANECDKHEHEHCKQCAAVCRECSEMCLSYYLID